MNTPTLPANVAQFLDAVNQADLPALLQVFAEDSIVNDQLQECRGLAAIEEWARREVIGERLSFRAIECLHHYGHCVVTVHADGDFDKRGLPDPLEFHLYFTFAEGRIVQLIVLRDHAGVSRLEALLRSRP